MNQGLGEKVFKKRLSHQPLTSTLTRLFPYVPLLRK